jgi:hypothetical protein
MVVGSTVAQAISIGDGDVGDGLAAEVTAEFQGESPAVFSDETPDDVSVALLRTPFSQKGPEEEGEEDDWGPASHQRSFIERSAARFLVCYQDAPPSAPIGSHLNGTPSATLSTSASIRAHRR